MKHTVLRYAEKHGGTGAMGMGEKGTTDTQQMSGMMHDMSGEMNEMSDMMVKGAMMDVGQHKQMDQMRKDMPAAPAKK